jgi:hypothetical protein
MKVALLAAATLIVQRALGWPGMPGWLGIVMLPMVFLVGPSMLQYGRSWVQFAIVLGLAWDLMLEPVIGPGGIAWSAAALSLSALAGVVADRSPKAWIVFGAAGTALVETFRWIALAPLSLNPPVVWHQLLWEILATALWCGLVGWILSLDLALRWRTYRARKLR